MIDHSHLLSTIHVTPPFLKQNNTTKVPRSCNILQKQQHYKVSYKLKVKRLMRTTTMHTPLIVTICSKPSTVAACALAEKKGSILMLLLLIHLLLKPTLLSSLCSAHFETIHTCDWKRTQKLQQLSWPRKNLEASPAFLLN